MAAKPIPYPPAWSCYDDIPVADRHIADVLIENFLNMSGSKEHVTDPNVRRTFMDCHVSDDGEWFVTGVWTPAPNWRCPNRTGTWYSTRITTSIEHGDPIFLKPSINIDCNYSAFMYVRMGHEIVSSRDVKLDP